MQSGVRSDFVKVVFMLMLTITGVGGVFWPEIKDRSTDWFSDEQPGLGDTLTADDLAGVKGYTLGPIANDASRVNVSALSLDQVAADGAHITFTLGYRGGSVDFPSLRIFLRDSDGRTVRTVEVAADDYLHSPKLTEERIALTVPIRSGEANMTVQPFYPAGRP